MKSRLLSQMVNALSFGYVKWGWWTSEYASLSEPIIIGGCGRSGTTLLRAMLNAHQNIDIGPETGVFRGVQNLEKLSAITEIPRSKLNTLFRQSACLGEFVDVLMEERLRLCGKARWGEKTPKNVHALHVIFNFFPRARFVHVIRDGRDVVCSLRDHPKYRWQDGLRVRTHICNPWPDCVARWVEDTKCGLQWRHDPRCREVRYEDLINEPEKLLREILEWCGEKWDPSVLDYYLTHRSRESDVANPGIEHSIYKHSKSRWKADLPGDACAAFNEEFISLLVELGYANDGSWIDDLAESNERLARSQK